MFSNQRSVKWLVIKAAVPNNRVAQSEVALSDKVKPARRVVSSRSNPPSLIQNSNRAARSVGVQAILPTTRKERVKQVAKGASIRTVVTPETNSK
jgi:hypothetical protein